MSEKLRGGGTPGKAAVGEPLATPRERIRAELERRGVSPELAGTLALRLEQLVGALGAESCEAVFAAALAATGAPAPGSGPAPRPPLAVDEVQRLLSAFSTELQKLDEALRALGTYLARLRAHAEPDAPRSLH